MANILGNLLDNVPNGFSKSGALRGYVGDDVLNGPGGTRRLSGDHCTLNDATDDFDPV